MTNEEREEWLNKPIHWEAALAALSGLGHHISIEKLKEFCSKNQIKTVKQLSSVLFEAIDYCTDWN